MLSTKEKNEYQQILSFIKNWQKKNEYKKEGLKKFNSRFNSDFNEFLNCNNFSKSTLLTFKKTI